MDQKTQRYIQRIDRIMLTPKRNTQQARPSRSPVAGPRNLDKYIKYELSTKIIQNIINKNQVRLLNAFFNAIRTTEFRQKEKIYKFIGIEKSPNRSINMDISISAKIASALLKDLFRKRYVQFINSLIEYSKSLNLRPSTTKSKLGRQRSSRQSSGFGILIRTSTLPDRQNYRTVSEWIEDSSALEYHYSSKQEQQKVKRMGLRGMTKVLQMKLEKSIVDAYYKIQSSAIRQKQVLNNNSNQGNIQNSTSAHLQKANQKVVAAFSFINFYQKYLASIMPKFKLNYQKTLKITQNATSLYGILSKIEHKVKFKAFHAFFTQLKLKIAVGNRRLKNNSKSKSQGGSSGIFKSQASKLEPNPHVKLNFYFFIGKIVRMMLIVSKMLLPLKDAFIKIDQYASFSYRLQQSLKIVPHRYLLDAFHTIKSTAVPPRSSRNANEEGIKLQKLCYLLTSYQHDKLVDGFILIKIAAARRPNLNFKMIPVKDNIIEMTKKFINEREQHRSHSYDNLNQLKNTLLSSTEKYQRRTTDN